MIPGWGLYAPSIFSWWLMAATKRQYHDSAANSNSPVFKSVSANRQAAQSFTTTDAYSISSVKILVYRFSLPETITVSIRAVSGDDPTGSDLAVGTFDGDAVTEDSGGEWKEITFDTPYELSASTKYTIHIRNEGTAHGVGPSLNWLGVSGSSSYPDGAGRYSFNGGAGWSSAAKDFNFETWGSDLIRQINLSSPANTATGIILQPLLQWSIDGVGAQDGDLLDIYIRKDDSSFTSADLIGSLVDAVLNSSLQIVAGLEYNSTYYWQVQAAASAGGFGTLLTSVIWSFTTTTFRPPAVSIGDGGAGDFTGENNMLTKKRFIAAANNKIWYENL